MKTFLLEVITPERVVFRGDVEMLSCRGTEGDIGILAGHQPLLTALQIWVVEIKGEEPAKMAVAGGLLSVRPEVVSILTGRAETSHEIDVMRAKAARERAEARLQAHSHEVDLARAEIALKRAMARLHATQGL